MQRPRFHQLEEQELRKMAYTGDSYYVYDLDPAVMTRKSEIDSKKEFYQLPPSIYKQKQQLNKMAAIETQPVSTHLLSNNETAQHKIDLQKIREIRWIIKRRYMKSRNFKRIFKFWDKENKGTVNAQNIYDMMKKLGINASPLECEVILASVDKRGKGELNPDDFLDFIYNDVLITDIDSSKVKDGHIVEAQHVEEFKQSLQESAKNMRASKRINQIKFVLKNHMKTFLKDLKRQDIEGSGQINHHNLEKVLKMMNISERVMDEADMQRLFGLYSKGTNKMDYVAMCEDIVNTRLDTDGNNVPVEAHSTVMHGANSNNLYGEEIKQKFVKRLQEMDFVDDQKIDFVDNRYMPENTLEASSKKMMKMRRFLKNYFPEQQQFTDHICKSWGLEEKDLGKKNIHQAEMKVLVESLLQNVGQKVDKKTLEGFYGTFTYNKTGHVNMKEMVDIIYNETEKQFYMRVSKRQNGPPPNYDDSKVEVVELDPAELEMYRMVRPPQETAPQSEAGVVKTIDDKMHTVSRKFFDMYRQFDHDSDGHVSCNDIRNTIVKNNWMNEEDRETFIRYVDPEKNGHVAFREFNKKIRNNMQNWDENWQTKERNIMQPSGEHVKKRWVDVKNMSKTFTTLKRKYDKEGSELSSNLF